MFHLTVNLKHANIYTYIWEKKDRESSRTLGGYGGIPRNETRERQHQQQQQHTSQLEDCRATRVYFYLNVPSFYLGPDPTRRASDISRFGSRSASRARPSWSCYKRKGERERARAWPVSPGVPRSTSNSTGARGINSRAYSAARVRPRSRLEEHKLVSIASCQKGAHVPLTALNICSSRSTNFAPCIYTHKKCAILVLSRIEGTREISGSYTLRNTASWNRRSHWSFEENISNDFNVTNSMKKSHSFFINPVESIDERVPGWKKCN